MSKCLLHSRHSHSIQDMTSITEDFLDPPRQKKCLVFVKTNSRQKWTNQDKLVKYQDLSWVRKPVKPLGSMDI